MKKGTFFVPFVVSFFRCKCKEIDLYNPKINGREAKSLKFDKTAPQSKAGYSVIVPLLIMMKYVLYALLVWFLYNLVFKFIIPIYTTTRKVKKEFSEMKNKMSDFMEQQQGFQPKETPKPTPKETKGDYIDFEEVK
jgi:hypothetical protein